MLDASSITATTPKTASPSGCVPGVLCGPEQVLGILWASVFPPVQGTQPPRILFLRGKSEKRQPCQDGSKEEVLGSGHSMCKGPEVEGIALSSRERGGWYGWETGSSGYGVGRVM